MTKQSIRSLSVNEEDEKWFKEFEDIHWTERTSISKLILNACKEYLEHHKGGNPNYVLEKWKDPDFLAIPAYMAPEINWQEFYSKVDAATYKKIDKRLNWLLRVHNEKMF